MILKSNAESERSKFSSQKGSPSRTPNNGLRTPKTEEDNYAISIRNTQNKIMALFNEPSNDKRVGASNGKIEPSKLLLYYNYNINNNNYIILLFNYIFAFHSFLEYLDECSNYPLDMTTNFFLKADNIKEEIMSNLIKNKYIIQANVSGKNAYI